MHKFLAKITISLLLMGISLAIFGAEAKKNVDTGPSLYRAVYKADYKGLPVNAKGIRELSRDENGLYTLTSSASSFLGSINESSVFNIIDEKIKPIEYQYHRSGIGKKRDAILNFNWEEMKVLNNVQSKPWQMAITDASLDKLIYQLQMREDLRATKASEEAWPLLQYEIADGGKLKRYEFEVVGTEVIDTPLGEIDTVKVMRVKHRKNRETAFWLAPKYEFLLVRLQQLEGNGKGFELHLTDAVFDGKPI
ncbi:MAG: hypothetical protein ACI9FB_000964 [Candidatus Azotimanducaceae bacterium]|jgi:hypothetical protein